MTRSRRCQRLAMAGLVALLGLLLAGCRTPTAARTSADQDAYRIVAEKERAALGQSRPFSIDTPTTALKPERLAPEDVIRNRGAKERLVVDGEQALALAVAHSPQYQTHKENLYLAALGLTAERHLYDPIWGLGTTVRGDRTAAGERYATADTQLTVGQVLQGGGNLGLTLANDLLRFYTGDPRRSATSALSLNLTRPLLRGAGREIAGERLKQAERNVIYEVRTFARYQQTFAVDILAAYYRVVGWRDALHNEYQNYRNLVLTRERAETLAKDRLPEFQVDQTRQDELRARVRYLAAVEQYLSGLDEFKLQLGLPLDQGLDVDPRSLDQLRQQLPASVQLPPAEAFTLASGKRLDLLNTIDQFEDAQRQVTVTVNQLEADADFLADLSLTSSPERQWERFDARNWSGGAGLRLKLPLDRLYERNQYRGSLITCERQLRGLALAVDQVKNELRGDLRSLEQARKNCDIQATAVRLAERRVESADLLLQAGRAETRDLLEAQSALVAARNDLTSNLVDYHLARLGLLRDLGMLELRDGRLVELYAPPAAPAEPAGEPLDPDTLLGGKEAPK